MFKVQRLDSGVREDYTQLVVIKYWPDGTNQTEWNCDRLYYRGWAFGSCAAGEINGFGHATSMAQKPAEFFAALFSAMHLGGRSYNPNNIFFLVSDSQLGKGEYAARNLLVQLLLDNGAELKDSFLNEAHGPNQVHLYRFNITKVIGKYIDYKGAVIKQKENQQ